jgi:hypothetical protein
MQGQAGRHQLPPRDPPGLLLLSQPCASVSTFRLLVWSPGAAWSHRKARIATKAPRCRWRIRNSIESSCRSVFGLFPGPCGRSCLGSNERRVVRKGRPRKLIEARGEIRNNPDRPAAASCVAVRNARNWVPSEYYSEQLAARWGGASNWRGYQACTGPVPFGPPSLRPLGRWAGPGRRHSTA